MDKDLIIRHQKSTIKTLESSIETLDKLIEIQKTKIHSLERKVLINNN
jgi:hypothetical protein